MKENKNKTKKFIRSAFKQQYPPFYLALSLAVFILLIGGVLGPVTASDWQGGIAMLNISSPVQNTFLNFKDAVTPMLEFVDDVGRFYELAAAEMSVLLVVDNYDYSFTVIDGVGDFYHLASLEMEQLLDLSYLIPADWQPQVAGACTQN